MKLQTEANCLAFVSQSSDSIPVHHSPRDASPDGHYVWRLGRCGTEHKAHRGRDGRVMGWNDKLAAGHPGVAAECGCEAVPFVAGETEFAFHEFSSRLCTHGKPWTVAAFVRHFQTGRGRPVTLRETGHLRAIAERFAYVEGDEGLFRRLSVQVADDARTHAPGPYQFCFCWYFEPGPAADPSENATVYGRARLHGRLVGELEERGDMLSIRGQTAFNFRDDFANPKAIGIEASGTPFAIEGQWTAQFTAEIHKDPVQSIFPRRS